VSDFEKRVDPNATIQLDKIDAREFAELTEAAATSERALAPISRKTAPPPLPPAAGSLPPNGVPASSGRGSGSLSPPAARTKTVVYGAVFLVLLGAAIFGGLFAGRLVRGEAPLQAAAASQGSSASPPTPAPATSGSPGTLKMPAVEINAP
jgi:anti-sigma factor RsiW